MCLAIPGKITAIVDEENDLAQVDVSGVKRQVSIALVRPEVKVGDWVLVHVGFAMSILDERQAAETLSYLQQLGELEEP
ncbi:MAG: HypC/HybG/HupF family hydrogenase formation chaperone [Candidatus Eremiobacterota bacterium]